MSTSVINPFNAYIDYITDSGNLWNPEKYLDARNISGVTESGHEFKFKYNYVIGTSYMTGRIGKDFDKIEVFYRNTQGFQIVLTPTKGGEIREGYAPYNQEAVKELLNYYANN